MSRQPVPLPTTARRTLPERVFPRRVCSPEIQHLPAAEVFPEYGSSTDCDEVIAGKWHKHFTIDMIQGGAGTSTSMNANEVIANRALEILGHRKGQYEFLHPNDDVNRSQSTYDAYPTAIKLGVILTMRDTTTTTSALRELRGALVKKAEEFADVMKMGRTENQDAVPMTLGQEFSAYAAMIKDGIRYIERAAEEFLDINTGATAVGIGINSPPCILARRSCPTGESRDSGNGESGLFSNHRCRRHHFHGL